MEGGRKEEKFKWKIQPEGCADCGWSGQKENIGEQEETEGNLLKQLDARFLLKRQIRKGIERRQRETTDPFVWDEVNATDTVALTARR